MSQKEEERELEGRIGKRYRQEIENSERREWKRHSFEENISGKIPEEGVNGKKPLANVKIAKMTEKPHPKTIHTRVCLLS